MLPPNVSTGATTYFSRPRLSIYHSTAGAIGLPCAVIIRGQISCRLRYDDAIFLRAYSIAANVIHGLEGA
eukprot:3047666-Pyramimonas_sp.AAC.1